VIEFSQTLPRAWRAPANFPTSVIFADHEVTEGWNMTRDFCRDIAGS
jgi:hypothetical protein